MFNICPVVYVFKGINVFGMLHKLMRLGFSGVKQIDLDTHDEIKYVIYLKL